MWEPATKSLKLKAHLSKDQLVKVYDWLQEFLKDHAPGTARSYLSSIVMFVGHLVRQGILRKGVGKALRYKEDIKLLSKQIRKKVQTRRTKLDVEEIGKFNVNVTKLPTAFKTMYPLNTHNSQAHIHTVLLVVYYHDPPFTLLASCSLLFLLLPLLFCGSHHFPPPLNWRIHSWFLH